MKAGCKNTHTLIRVKGQNVSAAAVRWFASAIVTLGTFMFSHKRSAVKPVFVIMIRNRVSKSCLIAKLCF